nr:uncharacterized protein LOC117839805 isoform X2 [Setaria viridis]
MWTPRPGRQGPAAPACWRGRGLCSMQTPAGSVWWAPNWPWLLPPTAELLLPPLRHLHGPSTSVWRLLLVVETRHLPPRTSIPRCPFPSAVSCRLVLSWDRRALLLGIAVLGVILIQEADENLRFIDSEIECIVQSEESTASKDVNGNLPACLHQMKSSMGVNLGGILKPAARAGARIGVQYPACGSN